MVVRTHIDRRSFLVSTGLLGIGVALPGIGALVAPAAAATDAESFQALSEFLTGTQNLDRELADRAYAQLARLHTEFPQKMAALAEAVRASGAEKIDVWLARNAGDDALQATAVAIVSAWYLGFAAPVRPEDDRGFVTFTKALMYEPTIDATVRPTYARGAPDYWIDPPPFVTAPPGPPGLKSWGSASPKATGTIPGAASAAPTSPPARSGTTPTGR